MKKISIKAQAGKEPGSPTTEVDLEVPETVAEASAVWGEKVLLSKALQSVTIDVQALLRRAIKKGGDTLTNVQAAVNAWKPDAASEVVRKTAEERVREDLVKLTPEQKRALMAQLQAQLKAQGAGTSANAA